MDATGLSSDTESEYSGYFVGNNRGNIWRCAFVTSEPGTGLPVLGNPRRSLALQSISVFECRYIQGAQRYGFVVEKEEGGSIVESRIIWFRPAEFQERIKSGRLTLPKFEDLDPFDEENVAGDAYAADVFRWF